MEWSKAKNIIIIAFLVLDVFLGIIIYIINDATTYVKQESIDECNNILKSKNISLNIDLPRKIEPMKKIFVDNVIYTDKRLRKNLLEKVKTTIEKKEVYQNKYKPIITIIDKSNSSLTYVDDSYIPNGINCMQSREKTMKIVYDFLKQKCINLKYAELKEFIPTKEYVTVKFIQKYKDYVIASSFLNVRIYKTGSIDINYRWCVPNYFEDGDETIVSPVDSIMILMDNMLKTKKGNQTIKIECIKLTYYVENLDKEMIRAEAIPAWEIKTNFKTYYVSAYENTILK